MTHFDWLYKIAAEHDRERLQIAEEYHSRCILQAEPRREVVRELACKTTKTEIGVGLVADWVDKYGIEYIRDVLRPHPRRRSAEEEDRDFEHAEAIRPSPDFRPED